MQKRSHNITIDRIKETFVSTEWKELEEDKKKKLAELQKLNAKLGLEG